MYDELVSYISRMDIREEDHVRISDDLPVLSLLVLRSLGIDGQIHRQRSVDDAVLYLALIVHLRKLCSLYGSRHLLVHYLYRCHGSHLRHIYSAGITYLHGVLDDAHLLLQSGIRQESHIRKEEELRYALYLEYTHMREKPLGTQSHLFVQN